MKESGYYPAGAEYDANAPYNEHNEPYRDFEVDVEYVLRRRNVRVQTNDYVNVDGYVDTENTDWNAAYEADHYTIQQLLDMLASHIIREMDSYRSDEKMTRKFYAILEDCQSWTIEQTTIEEV